MNEMNAAATASAIFPAMIFFWSPRLIKAATQMKIDNGIPIARDVSKIECARFELNSICKIGWNIASNAQKERQKIEMNNMALKIRSITVVPKLSFASYIVSSYG